jgi:hypothetical protein
MKALVSRIHPTQKRRMLRLVSDNLRRSRMTRFASTSMVLMLTSIPLWTQGGVSETPAAAPMAVAVVATQAEPALLEPGQPVSRTIAAGETHRYRVPLKANQVLHLIATQLGSDIVVTLVGSDGKRIVEMDTPTGTGGAESVWFVAPTCGDVQVAVRPLESLAGRYELKVETVREATSDDVKRVEMQAKFTEGNRFSLQRTPEAQQLAIQALKEAAALARSVGERDMFALSVNSLRAMDVGAALETLRLPSLSGKVPVYYSPAYASRATGLRDRLVRAVDFFEQQLRVTPKIYLAVLDREHWWDVAFSGTPYGMPNSAMSRSGGGLVCLPATHDAFDALGRNIKANLPTPALKAIESTGLSFEEGMREFGDSIMYHELGHIYAAAYGIAMPNRWVNELLANYLAIAYASEHPAEPKLENFRRMASGGFGRGSRPKHTTLEDFESLYMGVGFENYGWYQGQITRRAEDVYKMKKLDFLNEVKALFPSNEKRPIPVDVSLERLEKIAPGFLDWARELAGGAR